MYVLLYVDSDNQPSYIQGTVEEINTRLRTLWINGDIDRDDWDFRSPWELLGIEDGALTPIERVECSHIPHFEVY
jgi:hypothetical protein